MHSANGNTDTLLPRGQHSSWDRPLKLDIPFHTSNAVYLSQSSYSLRTEAGRVFGFVLALLYLAACILASQFQGCWAPIHSFDFRQSQLSSSEKHTVHLDSDEDSASCRDPHTRLLPPSKSSHLLVSSLAILRLSSRFNIYQLPALPKDEQNSTPQPQAHACK